MNTPDSFFNRFKEPDVEEIVARDWRGQELYGGEDVFSTDLGLVLDDPDEIREFMKEAFNLEEIHA